MQETLIKEIARLSEENGSLKAQLSSAQTIIKGLLEQVGSSAFADLTAKTPKITVEVEETKPVVIEQPIEDVTVTEVKPKRKYTRRKPLKSQLEKESTVEVKSVPLETGTVFKTFEPLDLSKIVVEGANTSAYVPTDKRLYNDKIAALSAGLGSNSSI